MQPGLMCGAHATVGLNRPYDSGVQGQLIGVALSFLRNFGIFSGASGVLGALSRGVAAIGTDQAAQEVSPLRQCLLTLQASFVNNMSGPGKNLWRVPSAQQCRRATATGLCILWHQIVSVWELFGGKEGEMSIALTPRACHAAPSRSGLQQGSRGRLGMCGRVWWREGTALAQGFYRGFTGLVTKPLQGARTGVGGRSLSI